MDTDIQHHLLRVVDTLRTAGTGGSRGALLTRLDAYARAGRFPTWDRPIEGRRRAPHPRRFSGPGRRAPRFRDARGTWCAVGHLMAHTDPALAHDLARRFEDRWLSEMDDPRIAAWADRHGFSLDELAWIQPGYCWQPPICDEIAIEEATDPGEPVTCAQADVRLDPNVPWQFCQDGCAGPFRVYVELDNSGEADATDVSVALWAGSTAIQLDTALVDVPAQSSLLVELQTNSVLDVNPMAGIQVVDPDGCQPSGTVRTVWEAGNGGVGWVLPDVCGGSCDTGDVNPGPGPDDTDPADPDVVSRTRSGGCGCAASPADGLGWVALALAAGIRRRRLSRPRRAGAARSP
jgi:MYXO-CTERM domain-containing protein